MSTEYSEDILQNTFTPSLPAVYAGFSVKEILHHPFTYSFTCHFGEVWRLLPVICLFFEFMTFLKK